MLPTCKGTVGQSFVACGESPDLYGYCSPECEAAAKIRQISFDGNDYDFVTDRLAIGNVASRATPGFVAVVSVLGNRDRPADEWYGIPEVHAETGAIHEIDLCDGDAGLEQELQAVSSFIAAHIRCGCVLVHCGAGKSRSVAVVIAYLCRYAGMSLTEALAFVSARRKGACPAPCFVEAIKRWLRLDELATTGPRR